MTKIPPAHIYTIPADVPFTDALAAGLVDMSHQTSPSSPQDATLALADMRVLLPTRRATRALHDAFLRISEGRALLLPRMEALGDINEDADGALETGIFDADAGELLSTPAIGALRRQMLLARLVMAQDTDHTTRSPDQALRMAAELASLLDQVHTERLSFERLQELVPDELADHWQITLRFLQILSKHWPEILKAEGADDPALCRNRALEQRAELWQHSPPSTFVIAAGSTGTVPATRDLLETIARMPMGMVILPGLDRDAPDIVWQTLEPSHPQYGMAQFLARLGVDRRDVADWPHGTPREPSTKQRARNQLINLALAPADATHIWQQHDMTTQTIADGLSGVTRIDCQSPHEEAAVIALKIRETLETPERTCALVTPDRRLARRVGAELARWHIDVDDSAGVPLAQTPPGALFRLLAEMISEELSPITLLAACKHPMACGGMTPIAFRTATRLLERRILRGPRPAPGIDGLRAALHAIQADRHRRMMDEDAAALTDFISRLEHIIQPLREAMNGGDVPLADLVHAHVESLQRMCAPDAPSDTAQNTLWAGDAGEALAAFAGELAIDAEPLGPIDARHYPTVLETLMAGRAVRPRFGLHPRVFIWGLLEARLQHADVMILGGLNEGTWPPEPTASPWMSRPMMRTFGLPLPERRIGLSAHDFTQAFCSRNVVLTRASRVDGTPQVESRWLARLDAFLSGALGTGDEAPVPLGEPHNWLHWAQQLDAPKNVIQIEPPAPTPPVHLRPRALSVTDVETWIRDPYALYARHILKLSPLDGIDAEPGAAERGTLIHDILETFVERFPDHLPDDAVEQLHAIGFEHFAETMAWPGVRAFWWPRFERIANWFVAFESEWRASGNRSLARECKGTLSLDDKNPRGPFVLRARADRIDRTADGTYAILDYKTGAPPSWKQVQSGLAPQLALEAAIARAAGFQDVPAADVSILGYMQLSGGRTAGKFSTCDGDTHAIADDARDGLTRRIAEFEIEATPYRSRPRPMFESRYGDFDHLARVREWRAGLDEDA